MYQRPVDEVHATGARPVIGRSVEERGINWQAADQRREESIQD